MSESIYAFLGLALVLVFSISQRRDTVEMQRELAAIEVEVLAHAVASEKIQYISSKEFDQNTTATSPDDLTPTNQFGAAGGCTSADECEDIDDFHNMVPQQVAYEVDIVDGDTLSFNFLVTAQVEYIDDSGTPTESQTWTKAVTLFVDQETEEGETKYLKNPIRIKRHFSPEWN